MHRHRILTTSAAVAALACSALTGAAVAQPTAVTSTGATSATQQAVPAGFNSQFNGSKAGWSNVKGNWVLKPGVLFSTGIPGKRVSTKHTNNYSDFYYAVRLHRKGNSTGVAANAVIIRGNPTKLDAIGYWKPSYLFQYANQGWVSVWKTLPTGAQSPLLGWTSSSVPFRTGYNLIEVWATDNSFDYHLNGTHIWAGTDDSMSFGQVGVDYYTEPGKVAEARIDWAKLITIGPRTTHKHVNTPLGKATPGGSIDMAPTGR